MNIYSGVFLDQKEHRQSILLEIIQSSSCSSQADIIHEMRARGFAVTQPSISRDFRELGVAKVGGHYFVVPNAELVMGKAQHNLGDVSEVVFQVTEASPVGANLLVLKTATGAASLVALQIDQLKLNGVVGTIAGDDTIFIATKNKGVQKKLLTHFGM